MLMRLGERYRFLSKTYKVSCEILVYLRLCTSPSHRCLISTRPLGSRTASYSQMQLMELG